MKIDIMIEEMMDMIEGIKTMKETITETIDGTTEQTTEGMTEQTTEGMT